MIFHSSSVSGPGFSKIASGMPILPMSWSSTPWASAGRGQAVRAGGGHGVAGRARGGRCGPAGGRVGRRAERLGGGRVGVLQLGVELRQPARPLLAPPLEELLIVAVLDQELAPLE